MINKNYNLYYFARMISCIGDTLQYIAIISIVAAFSNSVFISGLIVSFGAIVRIVSSFLIIAKRNKKNIRVSMYKLNLIYAFITFIFWVILELNLKYNIILISILVYEILCSFIYTYYKAYQDALIKDITSSNEKIARLYATDNIIKVGSSILSFVLLLFIKIKFFLVINIISFIISSILIFFINDENTFIGKTKFDYNIGIIELIKVFSKEYHSIILILLISMILTLFFSSYTIILQETIKLYNIDIKYLGIINAIFSVFSIIFSYISGFAKIKNIFRNIVIILCFSMIILILAMSKKYFIILFLLLIIYPLIGSGINTYIQIFFQKKVLRDDIPTLRGIYNILCGVSVLTSGFLTPLIISYNINTYFIIMILLFFMLVFIILKYKRRLNIDGYKNK